MKHLRNGYGGITTDPVCPWHRLNPSFLRGLLRGRGQKANRLRVTNGLRISNQVYWTGPTVYPQATIRQMLVYLVSQASGISRNTSIKGKKEYQELGNSTKLTGVEKGVSIERIR